ncbi:hypothetical protein PS941_05400 [Pseudomonas fluorescens]|uniref:Uncharacterized protein n=1 Tax=Pseudomonas fluorescens TaxID=294 RepID=A0A5E7VJ16_PSEFL|nr:hypothetical protein PS941_05400 [Pseudomonas fluorescens]
MISQRYETGRTRICQPYLGIEFLKIGYPRVAQSLLQTFLIKHHWPAIKIKMCRECLVVCFC